MRNTTASAAGQPKPHDRSQRPIGTRTPSSISCTSRRSSTRTATASAISRGLIQQLDYIEDLGVTALWLLPFYPSPSRTTATTSPTTAVNPAYGTMRDFRRFVHEAHRRGCGSSPSSSSTTPPTSTPGSSAPAAPSRAGAARLLCLERHRPEIRGHPHHLPRHREVELDLGPGGQGLFLAPLLQPPARPQLRQSARVGRRSST